MEKMIELDRVSYAYEDEGKDAVSDVTLTVNKGEFIAVLGQNGSGKSTLAKLLNGLYLPKEGKVLVDGMDTADDSHTWDIRKKAGMVFQNPDNQLVATIVREDVAFGLENTGVPTEKMGGLIDRALELVSMKEYEDKAPHMLSGGQKQRVAIAGILAMQPELIIFDEATAMLDPKGRKEVFDTVLRLNREQHITVIWITHFMEEAALAQKIYVMDGGRVVMDGTPEQVFSDEEKLHALRLDVPEAVRISHALQGAGIQIKTTLFTDQLAAEVIRLASV